MGDKPEEGAGEDDVSFLRTGDIVALSCVSHGKDGISGTERMCLSAEGFGNRMCDLENVSDRNLPPAMYICFFFIEQALSIRALQEMMSSEQKQEGGGGGGNKTLLYGHAVQLRHQQNNMFLSCLSTCTSSDKLAFDVGLHETAEGESCWWTVQPASKQRSEGEKVRVGDDCILVSVATERYLHMSHCEGAPVIASFHQTLWNINPVSSGNVRARNIGYVFGNDVLRLFHNQDECLTIPENWSEHPQHNEVIYEGGAAVSQARSMWRAELIRIKWHGALHTWEQAFRIRHVTTGRFLGVIDNKQVCLLSKEKADYDATSFILLSDKDAKRQGLEEKEEDGMGPPTVKYGESSVFIQHLKSGYWFSYQSTEVTKKGVGKVEEKKAIVLEEGHMDDNFCFNKAIAEESMSALVIRTCSRVLNVFLKGIEALKIEGNEAEDWKVVRLAEILKLMEDLIEFFAQPHERCEFEERNDRLRALRRRQDLFQEEGVLNMILDTIDKFSQLESMPDFAVLLGDEHQDLWDKISTYLYLLLAAMIKGNHSNCAQFAAASRLDWIFSRLSSPQSAEGILDVLYCVLTESPEALNMITADHIKSVIGLLEKVGRDPKVLDVLSSLCEGNGVVVRSSQNTIGNNLLPAKDLLLQTTMVDHVSSMMPNVMVGLVEGSAWFKRWYFETEVEHLEQMTRHQAYLRVGWANTQGFQPFPGCGDHRGGNGVGDDLFSYGFDGRNMWTSGSCKTVGVRDLRKGDVIGCSLDLSVPEIRFSLNGNLMDGAFRNFNLDGFFFPVMSLSAKVSCRFIFGGEQGKLRYGPSQGFSAMYEAVQGNLEISPCFTFGDIDKAVYAGSSTNYYVEPFVPEPIDIAEVNLPSQIHDLHTKLAENMHELWAMHKIENGWQFGEKRSESKRTHMCLTLYESLPSAEKTYNINLALDTLKTLYAMGYHMTLEKPKIRIRPIRLPNSFTQANGYKPAPMDTREIELDSKIEDLTALLARNTHNVWAKEKIGRGWTYGVNEDPILKRSSHLVPYENVDDRIKQANKETAADTLKTLILYGLILEAPAVESDDAATKEIQALKSELRTYRAERTYAVTTGKWYFEFEVLTDGFMKVGWMDISAPVSSVGHDSSSYGFDGYLVKKWNAGPEHYGKSWKVGDVVGSFLDLNDRTVSFSLNGELLLDPSGAEMAFDNINIGDGFVPVFSLAPGQKAKLNFGQDANSMKYFTTCGLQEGYEPFCVNMYRRLPMWYSRTLALFESVTSQSQQMEVTRVPATANNPPCLKVSHRTADSDTTGVTLEFIRLSLPVRCHESFTKNKDKGLMHSKMDRLHLERELAERERSPSPPPEPAPTDSGATVQRAGSNVSRKDDKEPTPPEEHSSSPPPGDDPPAPPPDAPPLTRKGTKRVTMAKTQSLDDNDIPGAVTIPTIDGPAMSKAASMTGIDNGQRPKGMKMMKSIGQKIRDVSVNRSKKIQEEKRTGFKTRGRSTETVPTLSLRGGRGITREDILRPPDDPDNKLGPGGKMRRTPVKRRPASEDRKAATDDDTVELQEMIDQVDEYYYGSRIFPSQDISQVWVGWVTPAFHYHSSSFSVENDTRQVRFSEVDEDGVALETTEFKSCYVMNAQDLLEAVTDQAGAGSAKVQGVLLGCLVDTSTGELSFNCNNMDTGYKFWVEPNTMLFPCVFVMPTCKDVMQFELGRIRYTMPISSAMFKSVQKSLTPICPPRLRLQLLKPQHWARVPNKVVRTTSLKLSETRGWSVLCDDPVSMMSVYVPERDWSYDLLEMIEHPDYLKFHRQTLNLYSKLCAQGNQKLAHMLCHHVDEEQLMHAIRNEFVSGPLRDGFCDLLIAIHMRKHAENRKNTDSEFVIPLTKDLEGKNIFAEDGEHRFPPVLIPIQSIRPELAMEQVRTDTPKSQEKDLVPPQFNFTTLKTHVMEALADGTRRLVMNCRDLIGGNTLNHFKPLLKLYDNLLVIGLLDPEDIKQTLILFYPEYFDENYRPGTTQKGLLGTELAEGAKIQLCVILNHLMDIQNRHRVESLIAFSEGFVGEAQQDQNKRYMDIKQSDFPAAETAKKTKEFRCPPKEQMMRMLDFKHANEESQNDDEEEVLDEPCPMTEGLQDALREFHEMMCSKIVGRTKEEPDAVSDLVVVEESNSWVDKLAGYVVPIPPAPEIQEETVDKKGSENFKKMIVTKIGGWAQEFFIEDPELIRAIFMLLLRTYDGLNLVKRSLEKTYVVHERNIPDIKEFIKYLNHVRGLLNVQFEATEEDILKDALWHLINNKVFFQHPDLMMMLNVHENVMSCMMNILATSQGEQVETGEMDAASEAKDTSELVVSCCKFLCYFCRSSSRNQKAMFEHLSFLLDNATMLLSKPSMRGSVPIDVAYSSFRDNNELSLALKEDELEKVATYLSRCGLAGNSELSARGYPDLGWDPVEGERYLDFLRYCVWVSGESVEENANLVIRLLIRKPECLGPALRGEGGGLLKAFKEAIDMSEEIAAIQRGEVMHGGVYLGEQKAYPSQEDEGEEYVDLGAGVLQFYSTLVDLLGKCAPDPATISAGKGESVRARAILRSLIALDDLEAILALRFAIPNPTSQAEGDCRMPPGLTPRHKRSVLLFLDRAYSIDTQDMFFRLLENSFLPDLRCITMLDSPKAAESEIALALCKYICNSVLPLLTNHAHFFADAEHQQDMLDATLHTGYRVNKLKYLTNTQRSVVSDFLVALTRELPPPMMVSLLKKVIIDIPSLSENAVVPLRIMTLHYERCGKYYGSGNHYGIASEQEKKLSMILFSAIFDSLGSKPYDPELFGKALPCLMAIASALSPDYALTNVIDEEEVIFGPYTRQFQGATWVPTPVDTSKASVDQSLAPVVNKFAEHFHDSWGSKKMDKGWHHAEVYSRKGMLHPRLKPFAMLQDFEKGYYKERCAECLRAMTAWGYDITLADTEAHARAEKAHQVHGESIKSYRPRPVDLGNMTLSKDMNLLGEKIAENSHLIWSRRTMDDIIARGSSMFATLVPWDLQTDFERRKHRFRAQEVLKFLQYFGYRVTRPSDHDRNQTEGSQSLEMERSAVEKRFAYNLLEKLLKYLEQAAGCMKPIKPSQGFTRRRSFKKASKDVKFFGKVVLPLMQAYFKAHQMYFLQISAASNAGVASGKEKEMTANLFCRLSFLLRRKNHAFGVDARTTVQCLQIMVQALDFRSLVKMNSDIIRTSTLMFFNNCAEDLIAAVKDVKLEGQYAAIRGANLKSWVSLEFAHQMTLPVLTAMFSHLAKNNFGHDLLLEDIQVACYKILDSLYYLTSLAGHTKERKTINYELDKHRPGLGQCLAAFARCFPVAFLETELNANNKLSVLAKMADQSVQAQEMLASLSDHIPQLEKLLGEIESLASSGGKYTENANTFDVDLPLICSYLTFWWGSGPEGPQKATDRPITNVISDHMNRVFSAVLRLLKDHIGYENAPWLNRVATYATQIISQVTADPVKDHMLPISEHLKTQGELAYREEERLRTHPEETDEGAVAEQHGILVRDIYAFFPLLIKYADLHRAKWLKQPCRETDEVYANVAVIFKNWSNSQQFKREEMNFMSQYDDESSGDSKGKGAIAERKKKRREAKGKDKHASSMVVACLKRLLPVGLNVFGGRELDIVQQSKEKFLQKENEDKIRDFIRGLLGLPEKTDPTDKNTWQKNLYKKIGKSQMRGKEDMTQEAVVETIAAMGQVVAILHTVEHPQTSQEAWRQVVSTQRKRAVVACFRSVAMYCIPRHRCINLFLPAYRQCWLNDEDTGQDLLIGDLSALAEESERLHEEAKAQMVRIDAEEGATEEARPDAILQLVQCFQRAATTEERQDVPVTADYLYNSYADVMAKSIHLGEEGNGEEEVDPAVKEEEAEQLRREQIRLAERGAAIMILQYLSACNGEPGEMVARCLELGIHLLNGGNLEVQTVMLNYLKEKREARFFASLATLMTRCSVLNLEMFERQVKCEGLGMGAQLVMGFHQNLNDAEFTCSLFRFVQLTCEGHNNDFQDYLRAQPNNASSTNLVLCTVDYLLRLQESMMDFYWHYSSKDVIDERGKGQLKRAIMVCSQVFNTITETMQGPCAGNQHALANSRLWDAINGFFFLFAHMMEKLSKNSSQLDLLKEFLSLQKDMVVTMLSMLEGNVLNGTIGKQMVDALVEAQSNVEQILKFFDMFLKLKDMISSQAFMEFDEHKDGFISPKQFQKAIEQQKVYTQDEVNYLMICTDVNNDGKVDYIEFTERFHNPAKDIGFNLAVLLTNLKEHITGDARLEKILEFASKVLEYFEQYLGRIEIMGSSKRVEKVYFEVQEDWLEQWGKQQIRDSKNTFLFNVMQDDGGDEGKLEAFVNFCEDTIFEMQHAAELSAEDEESNIKRTTKKEKAAAAAEGPSPATYVKETVGKVIGQGKNLVSSLKPDALKERAASIVESLKNTTVSGLLWSSVRWCGKSIFACFWVAIFMVATLFRFFWYMMSGNKPPEEPEPGRRMPALPPGEPGALQRDYSEGSMPGEEVPAVQDPSFGMEDEAGAVTPQRQDSASMPPTPQDSIDQPELAPAAVADVALGAAPPKVPSLHETGSVAEGSAVGPAGPPMSYATPSEAAAPIVEETKKEEKKSHKGSIFNVLARNIKAIEKVTLSLAFIINVILLFHRVNILDPDEVEGYEPPESGEDDDVDPEMFEEIYLAGFEIPLVGWEFPGFWLDIGLYWLAVCHMIFSGLLMVAFVLSKVPLATFKREKELSRRLLFDGIYLNEDDDEDVAIQDKFFWYIDRVAVSSISFPQKYWDKLVRKKARNKWLNHSQLNEEEMNEFLSLHHSEDAEEVTDFRYYTWLFLGVIFPNGPFLYRVGYLVVSICGVYFSRFFYAFHLIDVVLSFPMLKAILQSVTHNLSQLILTIMMTLVAMYIYTVIAFNFFRTSYVEEAEEEGDEPDRKCHNMFNCFIYHFYAGVRAGGGIGDELQSAYDDDNQYLRMLFDISFFFFVIVILLAIMQGLIIDAFGELRSNQEAATEKLESNCFICDIGKDYFDRLPKGFEQHVSKEHNFANFLFFIQYLINKDETEYSGQETFIREMYDERNWEFFPVGECFLKQYEDTLMANA